MDKEFAFYFGAKLFLLHTQVRCIVDELAGYWAIVIHLLALLLAVPNFRADRDNFKTV